MTQFRIEYTRRLLFMALALLGFTTVGIAETSTLYMNPEPAPWYFTWQFIIPSMVAILIPLVLVIWYQRQLRSLKYKENSDISARMAELEIQALQAQMNPHFIFNSINSIQAYMLDDRVDEALVFLSDFAKVVRASLENVTKKQITLNEDLEFLKSYLNLERMRFPDKVQWQIEISENVEPMNLLIPPMIMQPYVENAIKHGIRHKKEGGLLSIHVDVDDQKRLHLILTDNGIGRLKSYALNYRFNLTDDRDEHSTKITEKRLQLLNPPGDDIRYFVKVTDLFRENERPAGTRVDIFLPLISC